MSMFPQWLQEKLWNRAKYYPREADFDWIEERKKISKEKWEEEVRRKHVTKKNEYGEFLNPPRAQLTGGDALSMAFVASVVPQIVFAPIDRATRVLSAASNVEHSFKSWFRNFFKLIRLEGPGVIFRGHGPYLRHSIPVNALPLAYHAMIAQAVDTEDVGGWGKEIWFQFIIGALTGLATTFSTYTFERVAWHLADDRRNHKLNPKGHKRQFLSDSFPRAYFQVVRQYGVQQGLFEGIGYAVAGVTFHRGLMFGLYKNFQYFYEMNMVDPDTSPTDWEMKMREPHSIGTFLRNWMLGAVSATIAHSSVAVQAPWLASEGLRFHVGDIINPSYGYRIGGSVRWPCVVVQGLSTGLTLAMFDTYVQSYKWIVERDRGK